MKNSDCKNNIGTKCQRRRNARQTIKRRNMVQRNVIRTIEKDEVDCHPFHILSIGEYNKILKNNITLERLKIIRNRPVQSRRLTVFKVQPENIGVNLRKHFQNLSQKNVINMSQVPNGFMTLTMKVSDFIKTHNTVGCLGVQPVHSSGMILLSVVTYNDAFKEAKNMDEHVELFRNSRYRISMNGKNNYHHGTVGESYGVGLVAKYVKDENGLSFGTYADREKVQKEKKSDLLCHLMHEMMHLALIRPLEIIPNLRKNVMIKGHSIKHYFQSVLDKKNEHLNFEEIQSYMSSQFNINSVTHNPHTELDQSSTIIFVPNQNEYKPKYYFEFVLNYFTSIQVRLKPGTTIIYTPSLLVHRQISSSMLHSKDSIKEESDPKQSSNIRHHKKCFINLSAYFNKRLYDNIRKSMRRFNSIDKIKKSSLDFTAG